MIFTISNQDKPPITAKFTIGKIENFDFNKLLQQIKEEPQNKALSVAENITDMLSENYGNNITNAIYKVIIVGKVDQLKKIISDLKGVLSGSDEHLDKINEYKSYFELLTTALSELNDLIEEEFPNKKSDAEFVLPMLEKLEYFINGLISLVECQSIVRKSFATYIETVKEEHSQVKEYIYDINTYVLSNSLDDWFEGLL